MLDHWLENITVAIYEDKDVACPICGQEDTEHSYFVFEQKNRTGSLSVWCNHCKKGAHISRMIVPHNARESRIPEGIEFN